MNQDFPELEQWDEWEDLGEWEETATINPPGSDDLQMVTFQLGPEKYGLDILKVRELITYSGFTTIPNLPPFVKGVINLRGVVVPVLDLRLRFGTSAGTCHQYTVIIVVQVEGRLVGIIVDAVSDVLHVPRNRIQPPPEITAGVETEFIGGMVQVKEEMVILLDVDRMLAKKELDWIVGHTPSVTQHEQSE